MLGSLLTYLLLARVLIGAYPWAIVVFALQIWMFIDAVRRSEWVWAFFIIIGSGIAAICYFFLVYRESASATRGFELPGAGKRQRIKELEAQIHHLDKAHHYSQLGDVYFQQGKLDKAEIAYRGSMERDPEDIDTRAHFGQCLLRLKRPEEARPLLEGVVKQNPRHDYGHSMMALAETMTALGDTESAIRIWEQVTSTNSYARAKVQLAELYLAKNQIEPALAQLREVISDDAHAPAFERKRAKFWVRRARRLLGNIKPV
ncbi:MAG TPA: tetratricopeptide repeat protein [Candidatus Dormibacteraeota bacterium]|nr:tetratricopeptide repeat protein [Candidatus Dormibacteraeota bacterium]